MSSPNLRQVIFENLRAAAEASPTKAALIRGKLVTTYHQFASQIELAQSHLSKTLQPGSIVALIFDDEINFLVNLYAVILSEACAIPISTSAPSASRYAVLQALSPDYILTDTRGIFNRDLAPSQFAHREVQPFANVLFRETPQETESRRADLATRDICLIRYSSGTTGDEKGIMLSTSRTLERLRCARDIFGIAQNDIVYCPLPIQFHFVSSVMNYLSVGATVILNDGGSTTSEIAEQISVIYGSPLQYRFLLAEESSRLTNLRLAISTSTLLPISLADQFHEKYNLILSQAYGVFEVGIPFFNNDPLLCRGDLGRVASPYEYCIDETMGDPDNGELLIRGPGMFNGYLSEKHRINSEKDWFRTGDLVKRSPNGSLVYRGRIKTIINFAGNKIVPEEVEAVIKSAKGVVDCRVCSKPHHDFGEIPIAEIITDDESVKASDIRKYCINHLERYMVPVEIKIVDSITKTLSGKTKR